MIILFERFVKFGRFAKFVKFGRFVKFVKFEKFGKLPCGERVGGEIRIVVTRVGGDLLTDKVGQRRERIVLGWEFYLGKDKTLVSSMENINLYGKTAEGHEKALFENDAFTT